MLDKTPYLTMHATRQANTSPNQRQRLERDALEIRTSGTRRTHHVSNIYEIHGDLDSSRLARALESVAAQHQVLRSSFPFTDTVDIHTKPDIEIHELDLRGQPPEEAFRAADDSTEQKFNLEHGPCWRLCLIQIASMSWVAALTFDHLIMDRYSYILFENELSKAYNSFRSDSVSTEAEILSRQVDYYDISDAQLKILQGDECASLLHEWRRDLGVSAPNVELAWKSPAAKKGNPQSTAHLGRELSSFTAKGITKIAMQYKTSPYTVLLTAFARSLSRHTIDGGPDVVLVAAGNRFNSSQLSVMGWMANVSVVPCADIGGVSFSEGIERIHAGVRSLARRGFFPLSMLLPRYATRQVRPKWAYFDLWEVGSSNGLKLNNVTATDLRRRQEKWGAPEGYELIASRLADGSYKLNAFYNSSQLNRKDAESILRSLEQEIISLVLHA